MSAADLEGLEITVETLGDREASARIAEGLAALAGGDRGVGLDTARADLARRRYGRHGP